MILEFHPRPSVRAQLVASHDMIKLGGDIRHAGNMLVRIGTDVMETYEFPSEAHLRACEAIASSMLQAVQSIRLQALLCVAGQVQMPADCEPVA